MARKIRIDIAKTPKKPKIEKKGKSVEKIIKKTLSKPERQKVEAYVNADKSLERQALNIALELDFDKLKKFLAKHKSELNFDAFKTKKGHGFLYTLLNRFKEEDFFVGDVSEEDILNLLDIFTPYVPFNINTCTANGSEYDIGSIFDTYPVNGFDLKSTKIAETIIKNGFLPNYIDKNGENPLFEAGHIKLAELYLEKCPEILNQINHKGQSALFKQTKHFRILKMLIECGLDPFIIDKEGNSLLIYAVSIGMPESLTHLLKLGLDPNYINPLNNKSVLFNVQHKKMLENLIRYGVNLEEENEEGKTIIFILNTKDSVVKSLIRHNANINHQDKLGNTVLHYPENEKLLGLFATAGFDFSIKNNDGDTVLDVYTKLNNNDLYSKHDNTVEHIKELIEIQRNNQKVDQIKNDKLEKLNAKHLIEDEKETDLDEDEEE